MNKEIAIDCIEIITKKIGKQLTPDEYYLALLNLDKLYPMEGHNPSLAREDYLNFKKKHIQPKNFREAAEIYRWHYQKTFKGSKVVRLPYKEE